MARVTTLKGVLNRAKEKAEQIKAEDPTVSHVMFGSDGKIMVQRTTDKNSPKVDLTKIPQKVAGTVQTIADKVLPPELAQSVGAQTQKVIDQQLADKNIDLNNPQSIINLVKNDPTNPALLPKTKAVKEAENVIRNDGSPALSGMPVSFNPLLIIGIFAFVVLLFFILKK